MLKQKLIGTLLAGVILTAGFGLALQEKIPASAASMQLNDMSASLFLPEHYEEYLELNAPSDIAVCGGHIAISCDKDLFLFDRNAEEATYQKFTHTAKISKIQFSDDEQLYFSDELQNFYQLDLSALSCGEVLTTLTTFYIHEDTLFRVLMTDLGTNYLAVDIADFKNNDSPFAHSEYKNTPLLTFDNGIFYSVVEQVINAYSYNTVSEKYEPNGTHALDQRMSGVSSACAVGGVLYLSVNSDSGTNNGLYSYDFTTEEETLLFAGDGYGALTSYDGKLYAVKGNSVLEYSLENGVKKTDYEISSASDSVNRLDTASDSVRAGDLLVTADSGNNRLSIYDMEKGSFDIISVNYSPKFVATDGEIIAAASENQIIAYACDNRGNWDQTQTHTLDSGDTVKGITCVFGKVYYVSAHKRGVLGETPVFDSSTAKGLAANLYGDLFVAYEDGKVVRFTEANFTDNTAQGETLSFTLHMPVSSLRADREGNLYYLSDNALWKNHEKLAEFGNSSFVYGDESGPVAFALDHENGDVFLLYGNHVVKTKSEALGILSQNHSDAFGSRLDILPPDSRGKRSESAPIVRGTVR